MEKHSSYIIKSNNKLKEALIILNMMSGDNLTLFVIDSISLAIIGTLTDGDIRRALIKGVNVDDSVTDAMNREFHSFTNETLSVKKIKELKLNGITLIPILNDANHIVRILNLKTKISVLPIDAVLMAGGKGERLRPLTEKTPKPLLCVGDKPIIDYNIDRLISYGIENISVTVNYLKEQIEAHFSPKKKEIQVQCVREPKYLGTIGSVKFVENFHHDIVLVMNSDLFTNIDYEEFFLDFEENNADMSIAAVPYSVTVPYGIFELDGNDVKGILEKPVYNYYANAGIYLFKKELLNMIPNDQFFNATDFIELLIKKGLHVIRYPITGYWIDIGKHADYAKAQELAKHMN